MFTNAINSISINTEALVKNIMSATAILGMVVMILMLVAGTISIMNHGWASQEASTCGAIALCAGLMVFFACNYVNMH
mgnify:FL=1